MAPRASVFCEGSPLVILIPPTAPNFHLRITALLGRKLFFIY